MIPDILVSKGNYIDILFLSNNVQNVFVYQHKFIEFV